MIDVIKMKKEFDEILNRLTKEDLDSWYFNNKIMTQLEQSILDNLYKALEISGVDTDLLAVVGSWKDTLTETEVEAKLIEWVQKNDSETKDFTKAFIERLDKDG